MTTYYVYRLLCQTEGVYKYWTLSESDPLPTTCPTNTAHTIDTESITVTNTIADNLVKIKQENTATGGNYMCESRVITAATGPNVATSDTFTWPLPINILSMETIVDGTHELNRCDCIVSPDTTIGILTADAATGATGINVSSTVTDNTQVGFYLNLYDGVHNDSCGRVLALDKTNHFVVIETPLTHSFTATTPSYVVQNAYVVKDFVFGAAGPYTIGTVKITGSYVPAKTPVKVTYTNNTASSKNLCVKLEYLY